MIEADVSKSRCRCGCKVIQKKPPFVEKRAAEQMRQYGSMTGLERLFAKDTAEIGKCGGQAFFQRMPGLPAGSAEFVGHLSRIET